MGSQITSSLDLREKNQPFFLIFTLNYSCGLCWDNIQDHSIYSLIDSGIYSDLFFPLPLTLF